MAEDLQPTDQPASLPASAPSLIDTDPPAPAADDQKAPPAATDETAEAVETTEQQEARSQSKFQRRLQRQRDARVAAETELRLAKEQNAKLEAQLKQSPDTGEPKREAFESYEDYLRAVAKFDAKQETAAAIKADREANQGKAKQDDGAAEHQKVAKEWTARETAFQSQTKDYVDTVTPFVEEDLGTLSDGARRAIVESDVGPQLLYHLAKNPEDAERIADLSPLRQVAELGKLEVNMKPVTKKTTTAPAPPSHPKQGGNASTGFSENESQAEFEAKRKAQGARWARH